MGTFYKEVYRSPVYTSEQLGRNAVVNIRELVRLIRSQAKVKRREAI